MRRGKLAVIVHADVTDSTLLVQTDERRAHARITSAFRRFGYAIRKYGGVVREIRGDALVAEFSRSSDAVCTALAFQQANTEHNATLDDSIAPRLRIGICLGEVVIADGTVTGAGVALAQRVEQSAEPGGVCITEAIRESLPARLPFDYQDLGTHTLKGFAQSVHLHSVRLRDGSRTPLPEANPAIGRTRRAVLSAAAVLILLMAGLVWLEPWQESTESARVERMAYALPAEPSIAVLPFDNLSGDPEQDFLTDGFTEEIITRLSNTPDLFVISRHSINPYKHKSVSSKEVAEQLSVRYVLEGSINRSGDRIRVATRLVDALAGKNLWAERYDRKLEDLFALQDDITNNIAVALEVKLVGGEEVNSRRRGTADPEAFRLAYKAAWHFRRFDRENNATALELALQAQAISPDALLPRQIEAWTYVFDARFGWSASTEETLNKAEQLLDTLLARDSDDPDNYLLLSFIHKIRGEFDASIAAAEHAIELNPNHADAVANLAHTLIYAGRPAEAITLIRKAMRLSPYYPAWYASTLGHAYMMTGDYDKAIEAQEETLSRNTLVLLSYERLAATYALKGDLDKAREYRDRLLELNPDFTIRDWSTRFLRYRKPEDLDLELNALRIAGLPE
jgi:adenylate cyclase